jgi:hypothetical protein
MCVEDPARSLNEFHRLLKPGGELRLMVYNHDSIWSYLYVACVVQLENGLLLRPADADRVHPYDRRRRLPDQCRLAPQEMLALGHVIGFEPESLGAAVSLWELHILARRYIACLHPALPAESRAFLMGLSLDGHGHPWRGEHRAGIDGWFAFAALTEVGSRTE